MVLKWKWEITKTVKIVNFGDSPPPPPSGSLGHSVFWSKGNQSLLWLAFVLLTFPSTLDVTRCSQDEPRGSQRTLRTPGRKLEGEVSWPSRRAKEGGTPCQANLPPSGPEAEWTHSPLFTKWFWLPWNNRSTHTAYLCQDKYWETSGLMTPGLHLIACAAEWIYLPGPAHKMSST